MFASERMADLILISDLVNYQYCGNVEWRDMYLFAESKLQGSDPFRLGSPFFEIGNARSSKRTDRVSCMDRVLCLSVEPGASIISNAREQSKTRAPCVSENEEDMTPSNLDDSWESQTAEEHHADFRTESNRLETPSGPTTEV
jgi:hypothetical protein